MKRRTTYSFVVVLAAMLSAVLPSCTSGTKHPGEDETAKDMLQGMWLNNEDGALAFNVRGDSLYYPQKGFLPMHIYVVGDSLYMQGSGTMRYKITRQTDNRIEVRTHDGSDLVLVRTQQKSDSLTFAEAGSKAVLRPSLAQATDTVCGTWHIKAEPVPSADNVVSRRVNSEGFETDELYSGNDFRLTVSHTANSVFGRVVKKEELLHDNAPEVRSQLALVGMTPVSATAESLCMAAIFRRPYADAEFRVEFVITPEGKLTILKEEE